MIECLTAPSAFLCPRRGRSRGVLGGEVGVFAAGRGERGFLERPVEPFGAVAGLPGAAFAGGLVVAGALPGPGRELFGGREDAHVDADLGDDAFGGAPLHAGDRAQQLNGFLERGDLLRDHLGQRADLLIEEVDVRQDRSDPQRVDPVKAALQRLPERWDLDPQLALGKLGEDLGVGRAVHERVEHRPAGLPEDVRRDAVELDPGVLQRLVQPVRLPGALLDLRLAIPSQVPERPDRLGRHETRAQQTGLRELAQPRRIRHIGLTTGNLLHVTGVDQQQLEVVLQNRPDRLPIHAGRFHRDLRHAVRLKPIRQRQQPRNRRRELREMLLTLPAHRRASARTRSPAPYEHQAPRGAQRSSPSDLPDRDRQNHRPEVSEN